VPEARGERLPGHALDDGVLVEAVQVRRVGRDATHAAGVGRQAHHATGAGVGDVERARGRIDHHVPGHLGDARDGRLDVPARDAVGVIAAPRAVVLHEVVIDEVSVEPIEGPVDVVVVVRDAHAERALVEHVDVAALGQRRVVRDCLSKDCENIEIGEPERRTHEVVLRLRRVVPRVARLLAAREAVFDAEREGARVRHEMLRVRVDTRVGCLRARARIREDHDAFEARVQRPKLLGVLWRKREIARYVEPVCGRGDDDELAVRAELGNTLGAAAAAGSRSARRGAARRHAGTAAVVLGVVGRAACDGREHEACGDEAREPGVEHGEAYSENRSVLSPDSRSS
jgi:hypothetical protein